MIDLEKQKRVGIKQAKKTIANIYKKKQGKLTKEQQNEIARQNEIIARWQRSGPKGWRI